MPRLLAILILVLTALPVCAEDKPAPVRVTIVVILASKENNVVNPKLAALAEEVQKRDDKLVGFKIESVLQKSVAIGDSHTFKLLEEQNLKVTIEKPKDKTGRVGLTLKPPGLDEITYTCTCEKFFPVVTSHKTKSGEQLIIAVMAKPCTGKGP
jgi:hypothetical protein